MTQKPVVCIVGLGLMGGSLALALRRAGWAREIVGVSRNSATLAAALDAGALDRSAATLADGVRDADVIVLATPVRTLLAQLDEVGACANAGGAQPDAVVLDLGSAKAAVCAAMARLPEGLQPVGGHPMCGKETGGFASADADLYGGKTFVLCPLERTSAAALETARALAEAAGSRALILDPAAHDRAVAAISHLPYLAAAGLVNAVAAGNDPLAWALAASGFRDTTRVAASDPDMFLDILLTNRAAVLAWLDGFAAEMGALRGALAAGDEAALREMLAAASALRGGLKV
jgi:prephenate dehydrogenase